MRKNSIHYDRTLTILQVTFLAGYLYFSMPEATEDPTFYFALGPRVGLPEGEPEYYEHTGHWAVWFIVFPEEEVVISATLAQSNADFMTFSKAVRRLVSSELGALPNPQR